jgi:hypothetical protein
MSDLGAILLETDGLSITKVRLSPPTPTVANQCLETANLDLGVPVGGGSFDASGGLVFYTSTARVDLTLRGFIDQNGVASGVLKAESGLNSPCVTRDVTWSAVLRPGTGSPQAGPFFGSTDEQGPVSFNVASDGGSVTSISVNLPGGCPRIASPSLSIRFNDGVASMVRTPSLNDSVNARVVLAVSGDRALGVYAARATNAGTCGPVVGTLTARASAASTPASPTAFPAASPTPGPSSVAGPQPARGGTVGAVPAASSIGLLVTSGEMYVGELLSSLGGRGCSVSSLGILRDGAWNMFVAGAPAIVNLPFPDALPASTPFFVRCN